MIKFFVPFLIWLTIACSGAALLLAAFLRKKKPVLISIYLVSGLISLTAGIFYLYLLGSDASLYAKYLKSPLTAHRYVYVNPSPVDQELIDLVVNGAVQKDRKKFLRALYPPQVIAQMQKSRNPGKPDYLPDTQPDRKTWLKLIDSNLFDDDMKQLARIAEKYRLQLDIKTIRRHHNRSTVLPLLAENRKTGMKISLRLPTLIMKRGHTLREFRISVPGLRRMMRKLEKAA